MIENKIAADARIEHTAATPAIHVDKYTNNSRGFHQKRVLSLLQRGEKLSAADITVALSMYQILAAISGTCGQKACRLPMCGATANTADGSSGTLFSKTIRERRCNDDRNRAHGKSGS